MQSTKGIISRIPRGRENLKCVRITHLEGLEYLDVWATDRYCVLHLVICCSAAAPAVDTCVDHSALAAALAELKASPLTRVKLSESEFTIDSVTTAQAFKLSPTQLPPVERLGMLYLRRDNSHRAGDPEREITLDVEYAEVWQMPIKPAR